MADISDAELIEFAQDYQLFFIEEYEDGEKFVSVDYSELIRFVRAVMEYESSSSNS